MLQDKVTFKTSKATPLNRVSVIKAIRELTGLGLKEAKDASERLGTVQTYPVNPALKTNHSGEHYFEVAAKTLRSEGYEVGLPIHQLLDDLRELGSQALLQGEDELANEILQLVLAEKLRRKP